MGINISRAIGPALAGVLISQVGLYLPFMLNALSFIAIIVAVWWWKGETPRKYLTGGICCRRDDFRVALCPLQSGID